MEDGTSVAVVVGAVILGLFLLGLAIALAINAVAFAAMLFLWAKEQGFVGVALYVILWVIATPIMLAVCVIGGIKLAYDGWKDERGNRRRLRDRDREARAVERQKLGWLSSRSKRPQPGDPDYLDWANRKGGYSDS